MEKDDTKKSCEIRTELTFIDTSNVSAVLLYLNDNLKQ